MPLAVEEHAAGAVSVTVGATVSTVNVFAALEPRSPAALVICAWAV